MKLIDLDAEKDYLLDGKYKVKAGTDYVSIAVSSSTDLFAPNYCPNCGAKMDRKEQEHE